MQHHIAYYHACKIRLKLWNTV